MAVFAHGQLRLYLLALLEAGPQHGYELITALSRRFGGMYRPSAGTIYPRLARLEEEGLVVRTEAGRKTLYTLTARGHEELERHRGELSALEHELAATVRDLAVRMRHEVAGSMAGMRADVAAAAQQARAAAGPGAPGTRAVGDAGGRLDDAGRAGAPDERRAARARRAEAETELTTFRAEVRAALREAEARGGVSQLTADTVRTVLASARSAITATLPR
jgi:DNA-binding PadR family transcriptional regulator